MAQLINREFELPIRNISIEETEIAQYANTDESFINEYKAVMEGIYSDQNKLESFITMYKNYHSSFTGVELNFDLLYRAFWKIFLDPIILDPAFDVSKIYIDDEFFRFAKLWSDYWSAIYDGTQFWKGSPLPPDQIDLNTVAPLFVAVIPVSQIFEVYDQLYDHPQLPFDYAVAKAKLQADIGSKTHFLKDGLHRFFLVKKNALSTMRCFVQPYYTATVPIPYIKYPDLYNDAKNLVGI